MANELERENRELRQANEILKKLVQAHWRTRILPLLSVIAAGQRDGARPPVSQMTAFIEDHRGEFGVEPMCRMLQIAPSTYYERRAIARDPDRASARAKSDADLCIKINAAWEENRKLYGARKIWHVLLRRQAGHCTMHGGTVDAQFGHQGRGSGQKGCHDQSGQLASVPPSRQSKSPAGQRTTR